MSIFWIAATKTSRTNTLVTTADALRPISTIAVGDRVLAYDEATQTTGLFTVTAVLVHSDPAQVHLIIGGAPIETTPEHPFATLERGWVDAGNLWRGTHVRRADGAYDVVWSVQVEVAPQVMYNLTVAQAHTFFVGTGRWLVHNASGCGRLYIEPGRVLSAQERAIADVLVNEGRYVEARLEGVSGAGRTSDFFVDSVKTELKTISDLTSPDLSGALSKRIQDGAGQGSHIIADVRNQAGMTQALAERAIRRTYGAMVKRGDTRIQLIRVIGQGFDISVPFSP